MAATDIAAHLTIRRLRRSAIAASYHWQKNKPLLGRGAAFVTGISASRRVITGLQPRLDGLAQILADFVDGFSLRDAAGQGGNFGPVTARLVCVNQGAEFHGGSILNAKATGINPVAR